MKRGLRWALELVQQLGRRWKRKYKMVLRGDSWAGAALRAAEVRWATCHPDTVLLAICCSPSVPMGRDGAERPGSRSVSVPESGPEGDFEGMTMRGPSFRGPSPRNVPLVSSHSSTAMSSVLP